MGGAVSSALDNDGLVSNLVLGDYIKSSKIEKVFRNVDRADYFLPNYRVNAYKDLAWKSGNLHISAPCIYSVVMENLKLEPGLSFLNIGSGTGYFSTMAGLLLGSYGRNYGIELFTDVVEYAYSKLDVFKKHSHALDKFEFCEPIFIIGNGLLLDNIQGMFDRVYCGAACPESYEHYMKLLIKEGGVLVMPLNDQLVQITRVSVNEWKYTNILPVSFSILQTPSAEDRSKVVLPKSEPILLQEMCRTLIRRILKNNLEREHPELTETSRLLKVKHGVKIRKRRTPYPLPESDEEESSTIVVTCPYTFAQFRLPLDDERFERNAVLEHSGRFTFDSRPGQKHVSPPISPEQEQSKNAEEISSQPSDTKDTTPPQLDPTHDIQRSHKAEDSTSPPASSAQQLIGTHEDLPAQTSEELDSGIIVDLDKSVGQYLSSDEDDNTSMTDESMSDEEDMEVDSNASPQEEDIEELCSRHKPKKKFSLASESGRYLSYRTLMDSKINTLPIPSLLKCYLNLNRELFECV